MMCVCLFCEAECLTDEEGKMFATSLASCYVCSITSLSAFTGFVDEFLISEIKITVTPPTRH